MPHGKILLNNGPAISVCDSVRMDADAQFAELQTVKEVLRILRGGKMDVAGFLDVLCWGNTLAVTDPTTRSARTSLTHNDKLVGVFSRLLNPPRTSQGGSTAGGARQVLLPVVIKVVRDIIKKETDAVVDELKEESAEVTEESMLGTVIDEIQDMVKLTAPVFYDLVKTAAWSEDQEVLEIGISHLFVVVTISGS